MPNKKLKLFDPLVSDLDLLCSIHGEEAVQGYEPFRRLLLPMTRSADKAIKDDWLGGH